MNAHQLAWLVLVASPPLQENPPAVYTLNQIQLEVAESRQSLRSLRVAYEVVDGPEAPATFTAPLGAATTSEAEVTRHVFAARGPLRFLENVHFGKEIPPELDLNHNLLYFTGETLDVFSPQTRYLETTKKRALSVPSFKVRQPFFLECLAWWPPDDETPSPEGKRRNPLHEALAQPGYRVASHQEQIDGAWCHLVESPGLDALWLDPQIGFRLRRRDKFDAEVLSSRYHLSDYQEDADGIWIPRRVRRIVYNTSLGAAAVTPPVAIDAVCTVTSVQINDQFPDEIFEFQPPPGTLVLDVDTGEFEQIPGGRDLLDHLVELGREIPYLFAGDHQVSRDLAPARSPGHALGAVVVFLLALNVVQLWTVLRGRAAAFVKRAPVEARANESDVRGV